MCICQRSAYFEFIPHTHTHAHIRIPFEDRELTGLKVDTAELKWSNISTRTPRTATVLTPLQVFERYKYIKMLQFTSNHKSVGT